ncbi:hypothetical protein [Streptomyces collinus]|uniref:hypothetical protein n=1 Tax=Streptomyces collinus TaxID=42684 RepID=UPI0036B1424D
MIATIAWSWTYWGDISVEQVIVRTKSSIGCDTTANINAIVHTNGYRGSLAYRWLRNDGTNSRILHEQLRRGQKKVTLHLLWTIRGKGNFQGKAELQILRPNAKLATTTFAYVCK